MKSLMLSERDSIGLGTSWGTLQGNIAGKYGCLALVLLFSIKSLHSLSSTIMCPLKLTYLPNSITRQSWHYSSRRTIPRVHDRLLTETSSETLSSSISDAKAKKLPYPHPVIKEGLCIYPPVARLMIKKVPPECDTANDMFIPGGAQIGCSIWGIFWNKKI